MKIKIVVEAIYNIRRYLSGRYNGFMWWWHCYRGTKCRECADGYLYPMYGVAPHLHNLSRTGSLIGSTVVLSKEQWPKNFVEDKDAPGLGTFYCPNPECENSYNKTIERRKKVNDIFSLHNIDDGYKNIDDCYKNIDKCYEK